MANVIKVEFDVSDEARASATISGLEAEVEKLNTATNSTGATISRTYHEQEKAAEQARRASQSAIENSKTHAQTLREEQLATTRLAQETAKTATAQKVSAAEAAAAMKRRATESTHLSEQAAATRARLADEAYVREERAAARAAAAAARRAAQTPEATERRGLASAAGFAGSQLGLPGLGTLTSAVSIGGIAGGIGLLVAAYAGNNF